MRIGILTGGGDAPGLNGIIEAFSRVLLRKGVEVIGIEDGFDGIFKQRTRKITAEMIEGAHAVAGTLLGTTNKSGTTGREEEFLKKYKELKIDGLVACGGDGTFSGLKKFSIDIPLIGVPKTIDNDLSGTEITFGYDTACTVVAEAVDALRTTAEAHQRVIVVETMGREAGWIALGGGLASYSEVILVPERPFSRSDLIKYLTGMKNVRRGLVITVAEGAKAVGETETVAFTVAGSPQAERLGGVSQHLSRWIEKETGWESRHVVLGHLQRARSPTVTDRFLTLSMGVEVADMVLEKQWGNAVVYRQGRVCRAPITDLMGAPRLVTSEHIWVKRAQELGIFI